GGISSVLGGTLVLVTYFVGALAFPASAWGRIALASAPVIWLAFREILRNRYYQRLGRVEQPVSKSDRRLHIGFTAFTAVVSVAVIGVVLHASRNEPAGLLVPGALGYLVFVAAMPFVVWRYLRTPL